ncbi:MAG: 50S ribosomal protein L29 [Chloroflexi bacterium]|jgi:large subunit ribosomal protein L29|nr:50S ribosomal protein L29 [Chloroflexota bacterium]
MANIVELHQKTTEELRSSLESAHEELFNLRFQIAQNSLVNTARLGQVRRDIAQLNEALKKRDWALEEALKAPQIAAMIQGKEYSSSVAFNYEKGVWVVALADGNGKSLATADVDLNQRRRHTRRARVTRKPVEKVVRVEVA